jgi:hypothetical protein
MVSLRIRNMFKLVCCVIPLLVSFMPSVAKRKAKNTHNEQRKQMDRDKEAKKKAMRQQLPQKGQKR